MQARIRAVAGGPIPPVRDLLSGYLRTFYLPNEGSEVLQFLQGVLRLSGVSCLSLFFFFCSFPLTLLSSIYATSISQIYCNLFYPISPDNYRSYSLKALNVMVACRPLAQSLQQAIKVMKEVE